MTIVVASAATLVIIAASRQDQSKNQLSKSFDFAGSKNDRSRFKSYMTSQKLQYLMPLLSPNSALSQVKLSNLKPLTSQLYKKSLKLIHNHYQPAIPQKHDILNHQRFNYLLDRLDLLMSSSPRDIYSRVGNDKIPARSREGNDLKTIPKKIEPSGSKLLPETSKNADTIEDNEVADSSSSTKKKRHKGDNAKSKELNKKEFEEDEIVNEPISSQKMSHRISRLDSDKEANGDQEASNNSSYSLTLKNERSLAHVKSSSRTAENDGGNKKSSRPITKSAAIVLAPSLESIAMRIVSSAASKTIGRSSNHLSSSGNVPIGQPSSGESFPQSLLSSFSTSILSSAISQLMSSNSSTLSVPTSASSSSSTHSSTWPNKLSPLLYSLASLTGLNTDDSSSLPSPSSSFLSSDLSTSSSSSQPTLYTYSGNKPHNPKQYSPTVLGIVNLARYVLSIPQQCEWQGEKYQCGASVTCWMQGHRPLGKY